MGTDATLPATGGAATAADRAGRTADTADAGEPSKSLTGRMRSVEPGSLLGRYEILDELGTGGMATVYRATDLELRRQVAVKVLFPHLCKKREVVARFQREARAAASLDHPHILRVYDVGGGPLARPNDDGPMDPPYIVLELVRGGSLREFAIDNPPPLAEAVAAMGVALCAALSEAHKAGIIHRDIKPANIMVAEGGRLVLSDFGVARLDDDSSLVTRTGALLGTPAFMSPEQAHGIELDPRSDVYSLGATLYRVATGSMPFSGPTPRVVSAITRGDVRPPLQLNPKMGRELSRVIQCMMATEPDERYADARAAAVALEEIVAAAGVGASEDVLAAYFADPEAFTETHTSTIVSAALQRARVAAESRELPKSMALVDRVLALDPDNDDAMTLVDQLGRDRRRGRVLFASIAIVGVLVVCLVGYVLLYKDPAGPAPVAATMFDAAVVSAEPDAAVAPTDATPQPVGDAAVARVAVFDARPKLVAKPRVVRTPRRTPDAAVPVVPDAAVVVRAPADAAPLPLPKPATVYFAMDSWCNVTIGGTSYGRANPRRAIRLKPGRYQMVCSQGPGLPTWSQSVDLAPGQTRRLSGSLLRSVRVRVSVSGGDQIYIHRKGMFRNGASVALSPGRYRVQLRNGGQTVRTTWLTIPPVGSCTIKDKPALDCYR